MSMSSRWDETLDRLLAVLVALSLALTMKTWFGAPQWGPSFEPWTVQRESAEPPDLRGIVAPSLVIYHSSAQERRGMPAGTEDYARFWLGGTDFARVLQSISGQRRELPQLSEIQQARDSGAVEIIFDDAYKLGDLFKIYKAGTTEHADLPVDRFIITSGRNPMLYVRSAPRMQYVAFLLRPEAPDLVMHAQKSLSAAAPVYTELMARDSGPGVVPGTFVPRSPPPMAPMSVQREPTGSTGLLAAFFVDVTILRRIEERDGALIYSDGQRGVRIYPSGAIEYGQHRSSGIETDKRVALEQATTFAKQHGGLPGTVFVDRIWTQKGSRDNTAVRFYFRYSGVPVVGPRGIIEVMISPKDVESFVRNFRLPAGPVGTPRHVIHASDALAAVADALPKLLPDADPGQVMSMVLAYLNSGPEEGLEPLQPVWVVEFTEGYSFTVNAYNGSVDRRIIP